MINNFISGINEVDDVLNEWHAFIAEEKEKELSKIIAEENLQPDETRKFISNAFIDGEIKTTGTHIDKIMPPRFSFRRRQQRRKEERVNCKTIILL